MASSSLPAVDPAQSAQSLRPVELGTAAAREGLDRLSRGLWWRELGTLVPELALALALPWALLRADGAGAPEGAPLGALLRWGVLGLVLCAVAALRLWQATGPIRGVLAARAAGAPTASAELAEAERLLGALPAEEGRLRAALWLLVVSALVLLAWARGRLAGPGALGLVALAVWIALAAGAWRARWVARLLEPVRSIALPGSDALDGHRATLTARLGWQGILWACAGHGAFLLSCWALALSASDLLRLEAMLLPGAIGALALGARGLRAGAAPARAYFVAWSAARGGRGLSREEPAAAAAFVAAQALPYRLALAQAVGLFAALLLGIAAARQLAGWPAAVAGQLVLCALLVALSAGAHALVTHRRAVLPLLRHLAARHHLPAGATVAPVSLLGKALLGAGVATTVGTGLAGLAALVPRPAPAALVVGLGLAQLVPLLARLFLDLVRPLRELGERAGELARGELARPVPPAGEADEAGRLTLGFEEMRRALRARLRSTESINIDLEREVRRRTEALEQRNAQLHEALARLERAKDDLVRAEKLASMGRLVAGIAHEINNPVNAVINSLGPLAEQLDALERERGIPAPALAEAREILDVIQRGAERTRGIVRALHNYSRGDDETFRAVDLARSLGDTLDLLRHQLQGVAVERAWSDGLKVRGLPGQLDQVWMNLITNAVQAMRAAGGGTPRLAVRAAQVGDTVEVEVEDNGPGMTPEVQARIFDPFFTTKDVGQGAGLGLSIVHGIVERHGGRIQVHSAPGQGTRFHVVLPAATTA